MAIFCKLWRVHRIAQFRRRKVKAKHVIAPFCVVLLSVIALTVAKTILDPPYWDSQNIVLLNHNGVAEHESVQNIGECRSKSEITDHTMANVNNFIKLNHGWIQGAITFLHVLSWGIVLYMAWLTRNLPEDISDSRRVFQALATNCCVYVTLILLAIIGFVVGNTQLMVIAEGIFSFALAFVFVGFLVSPKFYYMWYAKRHDGNLPPGVRDSTRGTIHVSGVTAHHKTSTIVSSNSGKRLSAQPAISPISTPVASARNTTTVTSRTSKVSFALDIASDERNNEIPSHCEIPCEVDAISDNVEIPSNMQEEEDNDDNTSLAMVTTPPAAA